MIKKIITKHFPFVYALASTFKAYWHLEVEKGHFKTYLKWSAIDKNGQDIPWFAYPAIDYLNTLDLKNKTVFEYGSGNSTVYFSKKSKHVTCIENNLKWFEKIKSRNLKNCLLKFRTVNYVNSIFEDKKLYDIIIVDGINRKQCCEAALKKIKPGGIIILDNYDVETISRRVMDKSKLFAIKFTGFCPIVSYEITTAFYFNQ